MALADRLSALSSLDNAHLSSAQTNPYNREPRMAPVAFGGCFGWYHPAAGATNLAVLLCAPLGREARWAHRTFRKLADRLASAGLPTLRFDYPNTGDSCDLLDGLEPLAAWQDSVHRAADWLRAQTGGSRLVIVGLRFGALLAATAAASRRDVEALVLLAPVVSGRAYAREVKAMARVAETPIAAADPLELDALVLTDDTLQALGALAMPTSTAAVPHVMVFENGPSASAYIAQLAALGTTITTAPFEGYTALMQSAVTNQVPLAEVNQIVNWIASLRTGPCEPKPHSILKVPTITLRPKGCIEQPISFGTDDHLFGMVCRPDSEQLPDTVVVIGNSGGDPHTGIGRFGVMLARQLATQGIASIRIDYAGLGDSLLGKEDRDGHLYATDRRADVSAAIDALHALGFRRFATAGLCTGAYHALDATLADKRIDAVAMINLATFQWTGDDTMGPMAETQFRASASYWQRLKQGRTWSRALRGEVDARNILRVLARRTARRITLSALRMIEHTGLSLGRPLSRPRRIMYQLSKRGVHVLLLLSVEDPGIDSLEADFGRNGHGLSALPGATVVIQPGLDHTLSLRRMRDEAIGILTRFFAGRLPPH